MSEYTKKLKSSTKLKKEYLGYYKSSRKQGDTPLSYSKWVRRVKGQFGKEPGVDPEEKNELGPIGAVKRTQSAKMEAIRKGTGGRYGGVSK